jgi:hypothetical protein
MRTIIFIFTLLFFLDMSFSQEQPSWNSKWFCVYATYDDATNGTGHNTPSVGIIKENTFIACVTTYNARSFLVPYVNADSARGRLYYYGYGSSGIGNFFLPWTNPNDVFDEVLMRNAWFIIATPEDSLIYVANNDEKHNILVFKFTGDTILPTPYRIETGDNVIFSLDLDSQGRVYVINDSSRGKDDDIKIYPSIKSNPNVWETHIATPILKIDLPDGVYKGIEVNNDGSWLFVSYSDTTQRKVVKYIGSPQTGYQIDARFKFQLGESDTGGSSAWKGTPIGLEYLDENNLLFIACAVWRPSPFSMGYPYGRIYVVSGTTGEPIDTIDIAKWNFIMTGGYSTRTDGIIPGNASGYTSPYDVKFDEKKNLYTQSYYGWTVDKWIYQGTLPVIPLKVEKIGNEIPVGYELKQNYPNPFNPSTIIEFSIPERQHVSLKIYTILGQEVFTLIDDELEPGKYKVIFDAKGLASGTYIYTLRAGKFVESKKLMFVK